jgi:hypothetical protein
MPTILTFILLGFIPVLRITVGIALSGKHGKHSKHGVARSFWIHYVTVNTSGVKDILTNPSKLR